MDLGKIAWAVSLILRLMNALEVTDTSLFGSFSVDTAAIPDSSIAFFVSLFKTDSYFYYSLDYFGLCSVSLLASKI